MFVYKEPLRRNRRFWATVAAFAPVVLVLVVGVSAVLIRGYRGSPPSAPPATLTSGPTATLETTPGPTPTATPTLSPTCPPTATPRPTDTTGHVTIDWWHVDAGNPGNKVWQDAADRYTAAHPRVTINIKLVDNTPTDIHGVVAQLQAAMDAGNLPDLLPSWGGGTMAAEADACMLKDITPDVSSWKGELNANALRIHTYQGKQYGIPWDLGLYGFWYNKALFARAGITATPETWDQFLVDVVKLKAAKLVPYAIGEKDQWPGLHLWTYLVLREGGSDVLTRMLRSGNWNTEACVAGGRHVHELVAMSPFQKGYMSAPYAAYDTGEAAAMGNGQAAMELMGQWAESVQKVNSSSGKGIGGNLGWFPFPAVTGGKGAVTDGLGGSNGFAVGRDAPPEAIDFLHFLVGKDVASKIGSSGFGLPVTSGTASSVADPLQKKILTARDQTDFVQIYLDQAVPQEMIAAINAATAWLFDGTLTPEEVCQAITQAAAAR
jgi:raffinose/stachyose/melibiose transport system substrate-binding protein